MNFGEKLKEARLSLNKSQTELAGETGITERSIYSYEALNVMPRMGNVRKLAQALGVSVGYLMDEDETDKAVNSDSDGFLEEVKAAYGSKGEREAKAVLNRAAALFAGGELSEDSKDAFYRSLTEVFLESKKEARAKFTPKSRKLKKPPKE
jgi:transcriptional regulator with XRE-family HTH domain